MTVSLSDRVDKAVYIPQLRKILCCGRDKVISVLNTPSGRLKKRLIGHSSNVLTGCYVPEYNRFLTSAADRSIIVCSSRHPCPHLSLSLSLSLFTSAHTHIPSPSPFPL
eukprot:TRINITY_DN1963_c1_g1_i3.p2 TRINITY_DN1963_c1_g1~~TRINITY_DN1963_c1_g1_i3.p2  ORF type:complete len:109 (+),score=5.09 TRINITY_DN1963_c1_g1_i3:597-923(+)